jgi:hypothetical protein
MTQNCQFQWHGFVFETSVLRKPKRTLQNDMRGYFESNAFSIPFVTVYRALHLGVTGRGAPAGGLRNYLQPSTSPSIIESDPPEDAKDSCSGSRLGPLEKYCCDLTWLGQVPWWFCVFGSASRSSLARVVFLPRCLYHSPSEAQPRSIHIRASGLSPEHPCTGSCFSNDAFCHSKST